MYLKSLEMVGFKSFADRTKLEFGPGITAVVGPNGCGKSNISDAIRWVLGEQSARILRGLKMEDFIFNGTEKRKAHGMAEASITLDNCEKQLGTEFNEITITRRVFRSGEGQYFINKTPCRLKDIQRLFMGTGVGTNSYSLMEQGKIDQILSARPEDRRAVFEEASGITKYKADKREATRKLEATEINLQRVADIIKEVKRQIISLQRQAGKARRFRQLQEDLRKFDVFVSKQQIVRMDEMLATLHSKIINYDETIEAAVQQIEIIEKNVEERRETLSELESNISAIRQTEAELKAGLERSVESARLNRERILELETLLARDTQDVGSSQQQLDESKETLTKNLEFLAAADAELHNALLEFQTEKENLHKCEESIDALTKLVSKLQDESIDGESRLAKLRNKLSNIEDEERAAVFRRERLETEKAGLVDACKSNRDHLEKATKVLSEIQQTARDAEIRLDELEKKNNAEKQVRSELLASLSENQRKITERQAKADIIAQELKHGSGFPPGASKILDDSNPLTIDKAEVYGSLASLLYAEPDYRTALEAVLRPWLDAVVVSGFSSAHTILYKIKETQSGSARIIPLHTGTSEEPALAKNLPSGAESLIDHIKFDPKITALAQRLFTNVFVVDSLPAVPAPDCSFVTRDGLLIHAGGALELWNAADASANPLARKHILSALQDEIDELTKITQGIETKIQTSESRLQKLAAAIETNKKNTFDLHM
ncbi:MAG: AAA family ATPase, partial [Lentisphaerae bacterium]|nr:AAA family ATPase [Lentisphaerota bacterium]